MKLNKSLTSKRRKQRYNAAHQALHERRKRLNAPLSKELRAKLKKRTETVTKDCKVKILSGGFKGVTGKVTSCDSYSGRITVENVVTRKQNGRESPLAILANNVVITELREATGKTKKEAAPAKTTAAAKPAVEKKETAQPEKK